MLPDRVSNPGPLTYESGALPIALRGPACWDMIKRFRFRPFLHEKGPGTRVYPAISTRREKLKIIKMIRVISQIFRILVHRRIFPTIFTKGSNFCDLPCFHGRRDPLK